MVVMPEAFSRRSSRAWSWADPRKSRSKGPRPRWRQGYSRDSSPRRAPRRTRRRSSRNPPAPALSRPMGSRARKEERAPCRGTDARSAAGQKQDTGKRAETDETIKKGTAHDFLLPPSYRQGPRLATHEAARNANRTDDRWLFSVSFLTASGNILGLFPLFC
jgi:hypothetical protein